MAYPRDALALVVGHQLDFYCGDASGLRDRIGRALLCWDRQEPWFGFLLGMHAFGLEECGLYPKAENAGMRALEMEPRDVWAHHAVLHVHEMEGRFSAGLRFAEERRAYWEGGNFFVPHNAWHKALFHLEKDNTSAALEIYDRVIHNADSTNVALEMLDAAALLWRLHLGDAEVGGRWGPLADAWAEKMAEPPWYVFNDMHASMSFVGAGRLADARAVVDRLEAYVKGEMRRSLSNVAMTAEVGLPVCSAILAFGERRYGDVVRLLHPIRKIVYRFGGSHAQRDAVARTLLEAAIRDGDTTLATALVSERLAIKDTSPFNWLQLARLRRAEADLAGAEGAESTATDLRARAA
ncbi:MAG TPA: tetratricopeptide repeat protein [Acidimicrobiales bacterium]|nr:tetratricopeptide repeat protein [Acidimicrobiales bacterium]